MLYCCCLYSVQLYHYCNLDKIILNFTLKPENNSSSHNYVDLLLFRGNLKYQEGILNEGIP